MEWFQSMLRELRALIHLNVDRFGIRALAKDATCQNCDRPAEFGCSFPNEGEDGAEICADCLAALTFIVELSGLREPPSRSFRSTHRPVHAPLDLGSLAAIELLSLLRSARIVSRPLGLLQGLDAAALIHAWCGTPSIREMPFVRALVELILDAVDTFLLYRLSPTVAKAVEHAARELPANYELRLTSKALLLETPSEGQHLFGITHFVAARRVAAAHNLYGLDSAGMCRSGPWRDDEPRDGGLFGPIGDTEFYEWRVAAMRYLVAFESMRSSRDFVEDVKEIPSLTGPSEIGSIGQIIGLATRAEVDHSGHI